MEEVKEMVTVERVTTDDNGNVEDVNVVEWDKNELIRFLNRNGYEQVTSNTWKKVVKSGSVRVYTIKEEGINTEGEYHERDLPPCKEIKPLY